MRKDITINLAHDADIDKAVDVVEQAVQSVAGVLEGKKSPTISVTGIDLNGLQLQVLYWIDTDGSISGTVIRKDVIQQSVAS